ncbi:HAD family hydrolase [Arenicella xantha]|uniref:Histidinol-phosphatase n=1 Tax=Arenicella xantha TaxID=644221 RepID=A0A395JIJ3_9GAMM|nr:HAD family phosphatase [Arenicella xantha]RBP49845.1 HAD superfamily hydrolase (TIGR01490 family) [Arenicella xantha]
MALALFDLDNTLLNGDSDHGWGMYLAQVGAVDPVEQQQKQDFFYQQYVDGVLDIVAFCEYQFQPLTQHPLDQLYQWRDDFIKSTIKPMIANGKPHLLDSHRDAGDQIVIITATNDFVTRPIADLLGVEHLLATRAEFVDGHYTGKIAGVPCFREGKVTRLQQWLKAQNIEPDHCTFYSDSINDLPLLEQVDTPIAVTPDDRLRQHAQSLHWQIID